MPLHVSGSENDRKGEKGGQLNQTKTICLLEFTHLHIQQPECIKGRVLCLPETGENMGLCRYRQR